jgi:hypothetical protein
MLWKWLVALSSPSRIVLAVVPIFGAFLLAAFGPIGLRPDLTHSYSESPLSTYAVVVLDLLIAGTAWCLLVVAIAFVVRVFRHAERIEERRNDPAPQSSSMPADAAEPQVPADAVRFAAMEEVERNALGLFIRAGRQSLPYRYVERQQDGRQLIAALFRLEDRGYLDHYEQPYDFNNDGGDFTLHDGPFRRLSETPDLIGLDVPPRHFAR